MKIHKLFLMLFPLVVLASSCITIGPRVFHAPLFEEKGEMHVSAVGSYTSGIDLQFDYAYSDKFFLMTDLSYLSIRNFSTAAGSIGIGKYSTIGKRGRFSIYGGTTLGTFGNSRGFSNRSKMILPYAGLNLGVKTKYFEPVLTLRLSNNTYIGTGNRLDYNYMAWEVAGTLRFGGKKLKLHTQAGVSYPFDSAGGLGFLMANVGLTYRFNKTKTEQ